MTPTTLPDEIFAALAQLGLGQYEARAYCALLARSPMNGHEVAKASGVPPSKIYDTLARLIEKGAVLVERGEPVSYAALAYESVLEAARRKFQRAHDVAASAFASLPAMPDAGKVWSLRDRDTVLTAGEAIIDGATNSVFAALWDAELPELRPALEAAVRRGCAVHVAIYGTAKLDGPATYDLNLCGRSAVERLRGRRLSVLVADRERALIAEFHTSGTVEAISTANPVLGLLGIEYVKSDVIGRLLIDDMGETRFEELRHDPGLIESLLRA